MGSIHFVNSGFIKVTYIGPYSKNSDDLFSHCEPGFSKFRLQVITLLASFFSYAPFRVTRTR